MKRDEEQRTSEARIEPALRGPFTCPKCQRSHDRGPINGVDAYRCLGCGEVTKVTKDTPGYYHPDLTIDAEVRKDIAEGEAVDRAVFGEPRSETPRHNAVTALRVIRHLVDVSEFASYRQFKDRLIEILDETDDEAEPEPRRPTATLSEDERDELKRLRRSTLADLPRIFDEIGDAIAKVEALATDEGTRQGARECLRAVSTIRARSLGAGRESASAEEPYCDVCGRSGDQLTSEVEVCRDCHVAADYVFHAELTALRKIAKKARLHRKFRDVETGIALDRALEEVPTDCASAATKEESNVGMGERASGGLHDSGDAGGDRGDARSAPVPVRVPTERGLTAHSSRVVTEHEVQEALEEVRATFGIHPQFTAKGDELKCWLPDSDTGNDYYLTADDCTDLARALDVLAARLRTANPTNKEK